MPTPDPKKTENLKASIGESYRNDSMNENQKMTSRLVT